MKEKIDALQMSFHVNGGLPGIDNDPNNPISRASRKLISDGKPYKKMSLCFYSYFEGKETKKNSKLKWFGAFVVSSADRLIFFPGFAFTPTWIKEVRKPSFENHSGFQVDHITLEKNLLEWHYTSLGSKNHYGAGKTIDLGNNSFFWFGLSLASIDQLKDVKEETVYQELVPGSDAKRRMDVFFNSREGIHFNNILLHPDAKNCFETNFLHFIVIVGYSGFNSYTGSILSTPLGSPFVENENNSPLDKLPVRVHRISLNSEVEIEIIAVCLPGRLKERVLFTSKTSN